MTQPSSSSQTLKAQLRLVAKLGNVQSGLPPILRPLPAIAILTGTAISKLTGGDNVIENRILGPDEDETMQLAAPKAEPGQAVKEQPEPKTQMAEDASTKG
jgi:hypothetical protein